MSTGTPRIAATSAPAAAIRRADLPWLSFADGYRGTMTLPPMTARLAAAAILTRPPRVAVLLMSVRDGIVGRFGLKTSQPADPADPRRIGIFPVVFESTDEIVLGGDDIHLDFRIWIGVQREGAGCAVSMSTLVQVNNRFGRFYLAAIMPAHRMLSRMMLRRGMLHLAHA